MIGGDQNVEVAVVVEVGISCAARDDRAVNQARRLADAFTNLPFPSLWNSSGGCLY